MKERNWKFQHSLVVSQLSSQQLQGTQQQHISPHLALQSKEASPWSLCPSLFHDCCLKMADGGTLCRDLFINSFISSSLAQFYWWQQKQRSDFALFCSFKILSVKYILGQMINIPSPPPHLQLTVSQMNCGGRDQLGFDRILALTFAILASCLLCFLSVSVSVYIIWNYFAMWRFFLMIPLKFSINLMRNFTKVSNSSALWSCFRKTNAVKFLNGHKISIYL